MTAESYEGQGLLACVGEGGEGGGHMLCWPGQSAKTWACETGKANMRKTRVHTGLTHAGLIYYFYCFPYISSTFMENLQKVHIIF